MGRDFKMKKEPYFYLFERVFSCQKLSQAREQAFKTTNVLQSTNKGSI